MFFSENTAIFFSLNMLSICYNKVVKVHNVRMKEKWFNIKTNTCKLTQKVKCLKSR